MANEKKITKKEMFNALLQVDGVKGVEKFENFINHELNLLEKKNASATSKQTATQKANEGIKEQILECLSNEPNRIFTISEMQKLFPCCAELSNQRVSALVKQLVADLLVKRTEEKRKAYFQIAQ